MSEQRYKAVLAVIADGRAVGQVASEWGVCRQTLHRWLARYESEGFEGLGNRSSGTGAPVSCNATTTSTALNQSIANAMTGQGGGGGSNNNQQGLVNVNLQNVTVQVPVSVAVPIGVAANVCDVSANVLASQVGNGGASCTATSTSQALNNAIANAMV